MGKRFMNVHDVGFTPTSLTLIPCNHVKSWDYDPRPTFIRGIGDNSLGPTSVNMSQQDPQVTITTEDIGFLNTVPAGTRGAFTWTADNEAGSGTGDLIYTIANSIMEGGRRGGRHGAYAEGTFTIGTSWPDGITHPLSVTVAP